MKTKHAKLLIGIVLSLAITTGILSVNYATNEKDKEMHDELNRIESKINKLEGELIAFYV